MTTKRATKRAVPFLELNPTQQQAFRQRLRRADRALRRLVQLARQRGWRSAATWMFLLCLLASPARAQQAPNIIDEHGGRPVPIDPLRLTYAMFGISPDAPPQGDTSVEDVLVVFSPKIWAQCGGTEAGARACIQPGINQWNQARTNQIAAGTITPLNLLGVYLSTFVEGQATDGDSCLHWMADSNAGGGRTAIFAELNRIGADIAACVSDTDNCGLGYLFVTAEGTPFSSSYWNGCSISNMSFIHEIGHNHGGNHEPLSACSQPTCNGSNYGFGWGGPASGQSVHRDPLTYPREGGSRVLLWSTPLMTETINGIVYTIGTAQFNDNLKQMVSYGPLIAGFRARVPQPSAPGKPHVMEE